MKLPDPYRYVEYDRIGSFVGPQLVVEMKALVLIACAVLAALARADQAPPSRLSFTPPEQWQRSVDPESHLTSYAPPGGGAAVTFLASAEFAGSAEEWRHAMWSQVLGEMKLATPSQAGVQGKFLTRMGIFNKDDRSHPWMCLYTTVQGGRGEGALFYANDDKEFLRYLAVVNHMIQTASVSAAPSAAAADTPPSATPARSAANEPTMATRSSAQNSTPELVYDEPANFYRGASASPIEYSARDVNCSVLVYRFRPFSGDLRAAFQQTLLRDWIDPQFREAQLAAPPEFATNSVPGSDAVLTARFHDSVAGVPNERFRILIIAGAQAALVDVVATSAQSWQRASAGFNPMLASLRVERRASGPAPSATAGAGPQAASLAGLYQGTKSKYVTNLQLGSAYGSSKVALHYYLFSADGRVYCCYDFPPGGSEGVWRRFNFDEAQRSDPVNTGRYVVRGNQITIQMSEPGSEPITGAIRDANLIEIAGVKYAREP